MTSHPQVLSADVSATEALAIMSRAGFRHMPVVKGGIAIGIASQREIGLVLGSSSDPEKLGGRNVGDFVGLEFYSVNKSTLLSEVLRYIVEKKVGSVLVLDEGKVAGIFTITDACRVLKNIISEESISILA